MNEPTRGLFPSFGNIRNSIIGLALGTAAMLLPNVAARAGVIHHSTVSTKSTVEIQKADPWSGYWAYALKHHVLKLTGPSVHTNLALSIQGTLPSSPFVEYMSWREGLNAKRFDSFHPALAQALKHVKTTTVSPTVPPETLVPTTGGTPILPPGFTPDVVTETLNPPHIPEPSTAVMALGMIAAAGVAHRWKKTRV
jgi:hypothetical protein